MTPRIAWLGLDLGTQGVRALVVSDAGEVLGRGESPLTGRRDGARHEQDPGAWWPALARACRAATGGLGRARIGALAVCSTSGTVLLADAAGSPLSAAIMYDDQRAAEQARRADQAGREVWAALGHRMGPSWGLPKLLWLLGEHGPPPPGARLAHQADQVTRRLVGAAVATDSSHALKSGYDLVGERWPHEVMDALGVRGDLLPPVVAPGAELGAVSGEAARATGIPAGTPVIAGMTDGCAAQLAAGTVEPGAWNSVLGTTLVLKGVAPEPVRDPGGAVYSHRAPDGRWLPGGASSVGAGVLARRFPGRDLAALDRAAAEREPASVVAYPLASRGERFPFRAPRAEGFILGAPVDEADHHAALLQGVAFVERLCLDHLDRLGAPTEGELTLTGGATASRYWCQLRADVLGRPVRLPEHAEPALGMALLAASTRSSPVDVAARMVRTREVIEPRPDRAGRFEEPYLGLVAELARRGWVDEALAAHARRRSRA